MRLRHSRLLATLPPHTGSRWPSRHTNLRKPLCLYPYFERHHCCLRCARVDNMPMILRPSVASSGKAVIANGGVDVMTDNTFSETAFLGSPIYIRHLHLTTAMSATKETSYEGAVSICLKRLTVWTRDNVSPPAGIGCGAGIRDLTCRRQVGPSTRGRPLTGNAAQPIAPRQTMMMDASSNFVFLTRIRRCELRSVSMSASGAVVVARLCRPRRLALTRHPAARAFDLRQPRRLRAGRTTEAQ